MDEIDLEEPTGIDIDPASGFVHVVDRVARTLIEFDVDKGTRRLVSDDGSGSSPT